MPATLSVMQLRSVESPTLAIVNARVLTRDPRRPWADAALVRGERVVAVGSSAEMKKRAGTGARVIDARGMTLLPVAKDVMLAAGSPADLVIVETALAHATEDSIRTAPRLLEIAAGRIVFDRDGIA